MLLSELIRVGNNLLKDLYPEREAREMVFSYLETALGTKRHTHIVEPGYQVEGEAAANAVAAFYRMASGEPLQYVVGKAYFYGREFNVAPDVLIPRPETELLCRTVIDHIRTDVHSGMKILDLCTGSGCIAWTLALELPGTEVLGVDISDGALAVARTQDFEDEISETKSVPPGFIKEDVLSYPSSAELFGDFDIIVSNPPYVMESEKALMRTNVLDHEPHLALFVADDDPLVFYRAIAGWAMRLLKPGGFGMVEINEALGEQTADVFRSAGFENVGIHVDLNGRPRFVTWFRGTSVEQFV